MTMTNMKNKKTLINVLFDLGRSYFLQWLVFIIVFLKNGYYANRIQNYKSWDVILFNQSG